MSRADREREWARARLHCIERQRQLLKEGFVRATSSAPTLRAHGFEIVMAPAPYSSSPTRPVPYARKWAVDLVVALKGLNLRPEVRRAAFAEALELGRPGPLSEGAVMAGRMMK